MRKYNIDVVSLPVEFDEKIIDSQFRLVIAIIERTKELSRGAMPNITTKAQKVTTTSLEEVITGSVRVLTGEAAVKAKEESGMLTYESMMDEATQKVSFPDKLTELEKDLENYLRQKEEMEK